MKEVSGSEQLELKIIGVITSTSHWDTRKVLKTEKGAVIKGQYKKGEH